MGCGSALFSFLSLTVSEHRDAQVPAAAPPPGHQQSPVLSLELGKAATAEFKGHSGQGVAGWETGQYWVSAGSPLARGRDSVMVHPGDSALTPGLALTCTQGVGRGCSPCQPRGPTPWPTLNTDVGGHPPGVDSLHGYWERPTWALRVAWEPPLALWKPRLLSHKPRRLY